MNSTEPNIAANREPRAVSAPRSRWGWLITATIYTMIAVAILASCWAIASDSSAPELLTTSVVIRVARSVARGIGAASLYAAAYLTAALLSWLFVTRSSLRAFVTRAYVCLLACTLAGQLVGTLILVAASPIPTRPAVASPRVASGVLYMASDILPVVLCQVPLILLAGVAALSLARARRTRTVAEMYGYELCPRCRYILRGLPSAGRCPECGAPYDKARLPAYWQAGLGSRWESHASDPSI